MAGTSLHFTFATLIPQICGKRLSRRMTALLCNIPMVYWRNPFEQWPGYYTRKPQSGQPNFPIKTRMSLNNFALHGELIDGSAPYNLLAKGQSNSIMEMEYNIL